MDKPYVSSIVTKYGDVENVKRDAKTVIEILGRQGSSFLIDIIAEHCGRLANLYKLKPDEIKNLNTTMTTELRDAISEAT